MHEMRMGKKLARGQKQFSWGDTVFRVLGKKDAAVVKCQKQEWYISGPVLY